MAKTIKPANIYQKIQKARLELQDLKIKKTGINDYSKFTYYELADFLPAINQLCLKHDLFTRFTIVNKEGVELAVLSIFSGDQKVDFKAPTAEAKIGQKSDGSGGASPIQNLGGKITYMRRYMLMTAFEMVESDLVDSIKSNIENKLSDDIIKSIQEAKDFATLTTICGKLKTKYKVALIKPHYDKRAEELNDKTIKKGKKT